MNTSLKVGIAVVIIALIGWRVYTAIFSSAGNFGRNQANAPVAVEVALIKKSSIDDIGYFTGSLLPSSQYIVAPKITGRLEKIFVNIGDEVTQKKLIAVLDDDEYVQQVGRYKAELDVAKANVEEAKSSFEISERDLERVISLQERNLMSESDLDAARARNSVQEARFKVAVAQVAQREASLREARVRLSYTKIRLSGDRETNDKTRVVGERFVDEGALVNPNTSIVSILDINTLKAAVYIIERDYPKVKVGMEASITTDAFPADTFKGKILRIAPMLKETSREALIEIEIPNPGIILKPGMFVRVRIKFAERNETTVIPVSSLARREGEQGLFLADTVSMTVRFIPVQTGIVNGDFAEIVNPSLSGLAVAMGHHLLEDGSSIIIPNTAVE